FNIYPGDRKKYVLAMHDILKVAASRGICMELNTAGLRKAAKEIYPAPAIVQLAFDAGVGLTFGSDSHAPREVGMDFDLAEQLARSVGYKCINTFRKKQRIELPFD
ncbi:MAG: histidinol phosphate phosphatase, partial [Lentisphaeria bacterium]|nr:histidinol phosphate phosphatase [Lentisphaeria bacterium]